MKKKKEATGALGYLLMFATALLFTVVTLYLAQVVRLMTQQHHIDDSLTDSVLASLVADDIYYFETYEMTGTPVIKFKSLDDSYQIFKECMASAISETDGFYYNFKFDDFICYELDGSQVRITEYVGETGVKHVSTSRVGSVYSPTGEMVTKTSAYGKVRFDIKNVIDGSFITKTKDNYSTFEIND